MLQRQFEVSNLLDFRPRNKWRCFSLTGKMIQQYKGRYVPRILASVARKGFSTSILFHHLHLLEGLVQKDANPTTFDLSVTSHIGGMKLPLFHPPLPGRQRAFFPRHPRSVLVRPFPLSQGTSHHVKTLQQSGSRYDHPTLESSPHL